MEEYIVIKGAREHNLKDINLTLPRNKLIVITGLSGSGKSSLAFDTLYAEGRRRYVESLSAYARQFLGEIQKPDVDDITGLSPAISIDQKGPSHNPRSTVGTMTEIHDYLRLLYARIGHPHCPKCAKPIEPQTIQQMADQVMQMPEGAKLMIMAPLIQGRKGEHRLMLDEMRQKGFTKARVDGILYELEEEIPLKKNFKHDIDLIVDRLMLKPGSGKRVFEALESALTLSGGMARVSDAGNGKEYLFSQQFSCPDCGISIQEISPRLFSFNSPYGACPECSGIGRKLEVSPERVIPNPNLSLEEGALVPWKNAFSDNNSWFWGQAQAAMRSLDIPSNAPFKTLTDKQKDAILYGYRHFEGAIPILERRYLESDSEMVRWWIERYMSQSECPACNGARMKPEALAVTVGGKNIAEFSALSIKDSIDFIKGLKLSKKEETIARHVLKEVTSRLTFMMNVGLDYLTLDRNTNTLAGGEAQRIRLATQIGSGLVGVLYILDEPSIGLHQRDNRRLLDTLLGMRNLGNTVIVVEHDEETIRSADVVVDIGPGAGNEGGYVVVADTPEKVVRFPGSMTGKYLSGKMSVAVPQKRRSGNRRFIRVLGASHNNLKEIDVSFPLGKFICVTGVSGSGKSSLIEDVLYRGLARHFGLKRDLPGRHKDIEGADNLKDVIIIDQSPIGRTPRSNPATYTGVFTPIRELFASAVESRKRGYKPGRFSFNVRGGRCDACEGAGIIKIEMNFLPDLYLPCEHCKGKRYNRETLSVLYRGKNINDILEMTVDEAHEFFQHHARIKNKLGVLKDVGLGYIKLGQPATTLSGGEAQRVKLSEELSKKSTGASLYILDEPTTGLHFHDVAKLLGVLNRLVDAGNTVIVIEHNLDVIKSADHVIDLGPEGGDLGGFIVAEGTPEEISREPKSYTGHYMKKILNSSSKKQGKKEKKK
ncbi:MAG: excinuclease ABC subunit UvrA [Chloroflexi bacterium]|nr:excinuclease ABC subunit UvrA [Chloroflexota bacterium]